MKITAEVSFAFEVAFERTRYSRACFCFPFISFDCFITERRLFSIANLDLLFWRSYM